MKKKIFLMSLFLLISFGITRVNADTLKGTVTGDEVRFRKGPGTTYAILNTLNIGTSLTILGSTNTNDSCKIWYHATYNGTTGYICGSYVTVVNVGHSSNPQNDYEKQLQNAGFPSTYWPYLTALHQKHPNWVFKAINTGIDWNTAVSKESVVGVSLIQGNEGYRSTDAGSYNYYTDQWRALDGSNWYAANAQTVAFYMDPRNFLSESTIFMFEDLTYNSAYQTSAIVSNVLSITKLGNYDRNYVNHFMSAASSYNVSPIYLAARVRQEIGTSTAVISGASFNYKNKNYRNLYNPYNIGATSGADNWKKGLVFANGGENGSSTSYGRPWNNLEKAIKGGANYISEGYIRKNQYNPYLQKFNVANGPSKVGVHQYMTNIQAPSSEARSTYNSYNNYNILNNALVFAIPVFNNMPASTSMPATGNPNNYLKALTVNGASVPSFSGGTTTYTYNVNKNINSVTIAASPVNRYASISGAGTVNLTGQKTTRNITVKAQNGATKTYTINLVKSDTGNLPSVGTIVSNSGLKTDGTYITNIRSGTATDSLGNNIRNKGGNATFQNNRGSNKSGKLVTGDKVIINSGNETKTYNVVIYGDISGDGNVSAVDLLKVQKQILKLSNLSGAYWKAADTNNDGKISAVDLLRVQKHILGISKIS